MTHIVTLLPGNRKIECREGTSLLSLLADNGYFVESLCGGIGFCGRCAVRVLKGAEGPLPFERKAEGPERFTRRYRLACRTTVQSDLTVEVPTGLSLDATVDLEIPVEEKIPDTIKILSPGEYLFNAGDSTLFLGRLDGPILGLAIDAGTTNIEAVLVDLERGSIEGRARVPNRQATVGADIISRVSFGIESGGNRELLRKLLLGSVEGVMRKILQEKSVSKEHVVATCLSGNVFIMHTLLDLPLERLAGFPFGPPLSKTLYFPDEVPIGMNSSGAILLFPSPGGFVGGDLVSSALWAGLDREGPPEIMIDIGTNTEILLRAGGNWIGSSVPSGSAFEGASISCGMSALPGAITSVELDPLVDFAVVGGGEPQGIAGSGLISLVASMLDAGLVTKEGRILSKSEARGKVPGSLVWRLAEIGGEHSFILHLGERGKEDIFLTQSDMREFQLVKGALRAGIETLLEKSDILASSVEKVYLSGAFGRGVNDDDLKATKTIPPDFRCSFVKAGNGSLSGAYLALVAKDVVNRAEELSSKIETVSLGGDERFNRKFLEHQGF